MSTLIEKKKYSMGSSISSQRNEFLLCNCKQQWEIECVVMAKSEYIYEGVTVLSNCHLTMWKVIHKGSLKNKLQIMESLIFFNWHEGCHLMSFCNTRAYQGRNKRMEKQVF